MAGASQEYLDATKGGYYTTPNAWTTLAATWEASAFDAPTTQLWVDAGIQSPTQATFLGNYGVTPDEATWLRVYWLPGAATPSIQDAVGAVCALRSLVLVTGAPLTDTAIDAFLTSFFTEFANVGADIVIA